MNQEIDLQGFWAKRQVYKYSEASIVLQGFWTKW